MKFTPFHETPYRLKAIRSVFMPKITDNVIDVGASSHPIYHSDECRLTTIDIEDDGEGRHIKADLEEWKPDDTYNVIVASEVLEHLRFPLRFLDKIIPHLERNGHIIISVPNVNCIKNRVKTILGIMPYCAMADLEAMWCEADPDGYGSHLSCWNKFVLEEIARRYNLEIIKFTTGGSFFRKKRIPINKDTLGESIIMIAKKK